MPQEFTQKCNQQGGLHDSVRRYSDQQSDNKLIITEWRLSDVMCRVTRHWQQMFGIFVAQMRRQLIQPRWRCYSHLRYEICSEWIWYLERKWTFRIANNCYPEAKPFETYDSHLWQDLLLDVGVYTIIQDESISFIIHSNDHDTIDDTL